MNSISRPDFEKLAMDLWKWAYQAPLSKKSHFSKPRLQRKIIRASSFLSLLKEQGQSMDRLLESLCKPTIIKSKFDGMPSEKASQEIICFLLHYLRGSQTIESASITLGLKNHVTYYYWERGTRGIPLSYLLKCLHFFENRLSLFCEIIGFTEDLKEYGFQVYPPHFYENFFKSPWTPTVLCALQVQKPNESASRVMQNLTKKLGLTEEQVLDSIQILEALGLLVKKGNSFQLMHGQFYVPGQLREKYIEQIYAFWTERKLNISLEKDLYKFDQASVSYALKEKIAQWVTELREKIRAEVKTTKPETVIHMHWQVVDLMKD